MITYIKAPFHVWLQENSISIQIVTNVSFYSLDMYLANKIKTTAIYIYLFMITTIQINTTRLTFIFFAKDTCNYITLSSLQYL